MQRCQVDRAIRLILKLNVLEVGASIDASLGNNVCTGRCLGKRQVRLDKRALRIIAGIDPVSDVCRLAVPARRGKVN